MTQDLIRLARSGDEAALRALYEAHRVRVMRLAYALLGDADEAEDVMQDVMVHALTNLDRYDESRGAFGTWLRTMAVNRCRDRQRRLAVRARRLQEWVVGRSAHPTASDPAALTDQAEIASSVGAAIARLTPKQREAFVLREVEGLSYEELGEELGLPLRTAQSRVTSAYAALRSTLGHQQTPEPDISRGADDG